MKRLNCTYEPEMDETYPWLLKHPKVKEGLAKFKTKSEALEWFMLLEYETVIWFQNDEKIFEGQLTCDFDADTNTWCYYIKTSIFDGGGTYNGCCNELGIDPNNFQHDRREAKYRLRNLDFVLLNDPETYFPPELEMKKKTKKSFVDIEAIRAQFQEQINILLERINQNNEIADQELAQLKNELAKKDMDFNEMARRMELLKQNYKPLQGVEYKELAELNHDDLIGALALYTEKIRKILPNLISKKTTSNDKNKIETNYKNFNATYDKLQSQNYFAENEAIINNMRSELDNLYKDLLSQITIDNSLDDKPENFAYFYNEDTKENRQVAWATSFVLVDLQHVGFVPYEKYEYAIPYLNVRAKYAVTVINANGNTETTTIKSSDSEPEVATTEIAGLTHHDKKEIIKEDDTKKSNLASKKDDNSNVKTVETSTQEISPKELNDSLKSKNVKNQKIAETIEETHQETAKAIKGNPGSEGKEGFIINDYQKPTETDKAKVDFAVYTPQKTQIEKVEHEDIEAAIIKPKSEKAKAIKGNPGSEGKEGFVINDYEKPDSNEKSKVDFAVYTPQKTQIEKTKVTPVIEEDDKEFVTGAEKRKTEALVDLNKKEPEITSGQEVEEKPKAKKLRAGYVFLIIILALLLLGLLTIDVLLIIQLSGGYTFFNV